MTSILVVSHSRPSAAEAMATQGSNAINLSQTQSVSVTGHRSGVALAASGTQLPQPARPQTPDVMESVLIDDLSDRT